MGSWQIVPLPQQVKEMSSAPFRITAKTTIYYAAATDAGGYANGENDSKQGQGLSLFIPVPFAVDRWRSSRCSAWHTG